MLNKVKSLLGRRVKSVKAAGLGLDFEEDKSVLAGDRTHKAKDVLLDKIENSRRARHQFDLDKNNAALLLDAIAELAEEIKVQQPFINDSSAYLRELVNSINVIVTIKTKLIAGDNTVINEIPNAINNYEGAALNYAKELNA